MATEVLWLEDAEQDLQNLSNFIAHESPRAAVAYVTGLRETCRKLNAFPLSGRSYSKTYRALVYRNHLVLYRYDPAAKLVAIVAVIDGRRDLRDVLTSLGEI